MDHGLLLYRRLLLAVATGTALASSGCTDRTTGETLGDGDGDGDGGTTDAPTTSNGMTAATTISTSTSSATTNPTDPDAGVSTDDMIFDVNLPADLGPLIGCAGKMGEPGGFTCDLPLDPELAFYGCLGPSPDGCLPFDAPTVSTSLRDCLDLSCAEFTARCGPDPGVPGACCYWGEITGQVCPGRPFTVDGHARLAALRTDDDRWAEPLHPSLHHLPPATREALAIAWAQDGLFEHASVASFSRFTLHLLALGAPPSLIAQTQRAATEELEHARAFFGLASAYAGTPLAPGPLDVRGGLDDLDPLAMVLAAVTEGCIAETISALQIAATRDGTTDPILHATLTRIAEQELAHAELAWRFVAWALPRGDDRMRAAVAEAFAHAERSVPRGAPVPAELDDAQLLALGRLPTARQHNLAREALDRIVTPCAAALLEPWTTHAPAPAHAPAIA
ncbi:MAG: ferritin-like domain-containing protein [Nannocystaceae bacterium]